MTGRTIIEVKHTLAGTRKEFTCTLCDAREDEVVVLYVSTRDSQIAGVILSRGTLSFGYFWPARPYNAYHWLAPDGHTLGLYFNISDRTRISPARICWRDLTVDVLVTPDGRCRVLDEEDLPEDLDAGLRQTVEATRDYLLREHRALLAQIERRSAALFAEHKSGRSRRCP
jgi:predicted RNA-binding protein associated with RNAse of E/G family